MILLFSFFITNLLQYNWKLLNAYKIFDSQ